MANFLFKPPKHLVKEWPEVFEDLYMNTMPVVYIDYVRLEFSNGRIWEVDVKELLNQKTPEAIATQLLETLQEYKSEITKIDFKVNVEKLKIDINNSTNSIF